MNKRLVRFWLCGVVCLCALVLSVRTSLAGSPDQGAKTLIALDSDWSKAAVAKDIDKVASFYAEDAVAYPPNEPVAVGRKTAREVWARYFADPTFQISWKTTDAGVDGNLGWTAGTYQDSFKAPDGKTAMGTGKYVCVWRRGADGRWKAIRDIWNSDSK